MMQIDTTNILFICGGAFDGIDRIIKNRLGQNTIGFGSKVKSKAELSEDEVLAKLEPEDLLKAGLIPEFIGRVPVTVTLNALSEEALCQIITEPRNALMKQYQKLLNMDGVKLTLDEGAVKAIAKKAMKRKTGARGLRSIVEDVMRDVMYELPSLEGASACRITAEVINGRQKPIITMQPAPAENGRRAVTA